VPTSEEVEAFLVAEGYTVREVRQLGEGVIQLLTDQGPVVNVLATGTVEVQGRDKPGLESKLTTRRWLR
jgi:hypothetical protein